MSSPSEFAGDLPESNPHDERSAGERSVERRALADLISEIMAGAAAGLARTRLGVADTTRLVAAIGRIAETLGEDERRNITEVKKNPGAVLAAAIESRPVLLADGKRREAEEAMLLPAVDVELMVRFIGEVAAPRVSGADLYARFARDGVPSGVSLAPPPEEPYVTPDFAAVLGRKSA